MKYEQYLVLAFFATVASAQVPKLTTDLAIRPGSLTHTSVALEWRTDIASSTQADYGTAAGVLDEMVRKDGANTLHQLTVTGLTPGTTYYLRAVSSANGQTAYSNQITFATLPEPPDRWRDPEPPARISSKAYPVINGGTLAVAPDCSNLQAQMNLAAQIAGSGVNPEVVIPAGSACTGNYRLPAVYGKGIAVLRSSAVGTPEFPPEGTRLDPARYRKMLATIQTARTRSNNGGTQSSEAAIYVPNNGNNWRLVGLEITHTEYQAAFELYKCKATTPILCTTAPNHGLQTGYVIQVFDVQGLNGANGSRKVTVVDPQTIVLNNTVGSGKFISGKWTMDPPFVYGLVMIYPPNAYNIIFDRCWIHARGFPYRVPYAAVLGCNDCGIINSAVENGTWRGINPDTKQILSGAPYTVSVPASIGVSASEATDRVEFTNNHLRADLLGFMVEVNGKPGPPPSDFVIERNTFEMPDEYRWHVNNPKWNGLFRDNRQPLEFKAMLRSRIVGNRFINQWEALSSHGFAVVMTPRGHNSAPSKLLTLSEMRCESNLFYNIPSGFYIVGTDSAVTDVRVSSKFLIKNNLWWRIRGREQVMGGKTSGGMCLGITAGVEDIRVENNTCWDGTGKWSMPLMMGYRRGGGLKLLNNVFTVHREFHEFFVLAGGNGVSFLPAIPNTVTDQYNALLALGGRGSEAKGNVFIPGVRNSADRAYYDSTSATLSIFKEACESSSMMGGFVAAGNVCSGPAGAVSANERFAYFGYVDPARMNMRFRPDSPYGHSGPQNPTTDGGNPGVDMRKLESDLGVVADVQLTDVTRNAATIHYTPPDGEACHVDYAAGPFPASGLPVIRLHDGGGNWRRSVRLAPLAPGTTYQFVVQCAVEQPSGSFTTAP